MQEIIRKTQLSSEYRKEKSPFGLRPDVLKSGLQKYIRRGEEKKALWCSLELASFVYSELRGKAIVTNLIHRLMVIYLEDVYMGGSLDWQWVDKLIFRLVLNRAQENVGPFLDATLTLVKACSGNISRSRYLSHVNMAATFVKEPPDLNHFPRVKKLYEGRSAKKMDPVLKLGKKDEKMEMEIGHLMDCLNRQDDQAFYWAKQIFLGLGEGDTHFGRRKPIYTILWVLNEWGRKNGKELPIGVALKWAKELGNLNEVFLVYAGLIAQCLGKVTSVPVQATEEENGMGLLEKHLTGSCMELDDYVYDMHTASGRNHGKGHKDFALEGSLVVNEVEIDKEYHDFYNAMKLGNVSATKRESEWFSFIMRAQLVTGAYRTDTYFALRDRKGVFVKGPFLLKERAMIAVKINQLKLYWEGIETNTMEVIEALPDLFPNTPLGLRKLIDRARPAFFLVVRSLYNVKELPVCEKSSKLWPLTRVVDFAQMKNGVITLADLDSATFHQLVLTLVFRYILGIPDSALRNYLVIEGKVYSIDEEGIAKDVSVYNSLKKNICDEILAKMDKNFIQEKVKRWKIGVEKIEEIFSREEFLVVKERWEKVVGEGVERIFSP